MERTQTRDQLNLHLARALAVASLVIALVACGDDDGGQANAGSGARDPLYAMMTQVYSQDDRTVYITLSNTLDITNVDLGDAREFPGVANFAGIGGKLLVSSGEEPTITEFDISNDFEWTEGRTLSFANYPLGDNANFYGHFILNEQVAYLPFEASRRLVWNPAEMEIIGEMTDTVLPTAEGDLTLMSGGNRQGIKFQNQVMHPLFFVDETDWVDHGTHSLVAVYDAQTHEESEVLDLPCAGLSIATQDEDGNTYFGTWDYTGALALYGLGPEPCMVKVKPDLTIEETFTTDFTHLTDGRYVNNFRYIGGGKAIGNVFHHDELEHDWTPPYDGDYVDEYVWGNGPQWQLWMFDLAEETATPVEGITEALGSGAQFAVLDGRTFLFLPFDDWSKSAVYEIDDTGMATRRFEVAGDIFKWVRVR